MIAAKIEAKGTMVVPDAPHCYLNALAPERLARLLKAIEPDADEVSISLAPESTVETHLLNIRGAVARCASFDAFYHVTYPLEPRPHVRVVLTRFNNNNLSVIGRFFVQPLDSKLVSSKADEKENQFMIVHDEEWILRRWMIMFALPLRIYLKWKVKAEVRRMGEFVAHEQGKPQCEGVGVRNSTATITWFLNREDESMRLQRKLTEK